MRDYEYELTSEGIFTCRTSIIAFEYIMMIDSLTRSIRLDIMGKNRRSSVWNYFVKKEADPNNATCNLSKTKVRAVDSSTFNLFAHLRVHHRLQYLLVKTPAREKSQTTSTANALSEW